MDAQHNISIVSSNQIDGSSSQAFNIAHRARITNSVIMAIKYFRLNQCLGSLARSSKNCEQANKYDLEYC